jgi:hypothetical protein
MNAYFARLMGPNIAAFLLVAPPVMARTAQGPSTSAEVTRSFMPDEEGEPETAVLHRRYKGSFIYPIPIGILSGMFVLTGDIVRNERVYQTAKTASGIPPQPNIFPPAPANQALGGFGTLYIPHHQEGAPLFEVEIRRWNRLAQPEFVAPLWETTLSSSMDAKDLPFSIFISPRDEAAITAKLTYQRYLGAERWIPQLGYRLKRPSGWELDLLAPLHALIARQKSPETWRIYGGVRWSPRVDPFLRPATDSAPRFSGWTMGWTTTILSGVRLPVWLPLYASIEAGIQRELYKAYTEKGDPMTSLRTTWGPWAQVALETWIRTP